MLFQPEPALWLVGVGRRWGGGRGQTQSTASLSCRHCPQHIFPKHTMMCHFPYEGGWLGVGRCQTQSPQLTQGGGLILRELDTGWLEAAGRRTGETGSFEMPSPRLGSLSSSPHNVDVSWAPTGSCSPPTLPHAGNRGTAIAHVGRLDSDLELPTPQSPTISQP